MTRWWLLLPFFPPCVHDKKKKCIYFLNVLYLFCFPWFIFFQVTCHAFHCHFRCIRLFSLHILKKKASGPNLFCYLFFLNPTIFYLIHIHFLITSPAVSFVLSCFCSLSLCPEGLQLVHIYFILIFVLLAITQKNDKKKKT